MSCVLFSMEHNHVAIKIFLGCMVLNFPLIIFFAVKLYINISIYFWGEVIFSWLGLGAGKVVSTATKVDCLADFRVKMVALGLEHSIAVTGD